MFNRKSFFFYVSISTLIASFGCHAGIEEAFDLSRDIMESRYRDSSLRLSTCKRCRGDEGSTQEDSETLFAQTFPNLKVKNKKEFLSECIDKTAPVTEGFKLLASLLESANRDAENATVFYKHAAFQAQKRSGTLEILTNKLKKVNANLDQDFFYASLANHINDYQEIMNFMAPYITDKDLTNYDDNNLRVTVSHYTPQDTSYLQYIPLNKGEVQTVLVADDQQKKEETKLPKKKKKKEKKNLGDQANALKVEGANTLEGSSTQEVPPQVLADTSKIEPEQDLSSQDLSPLKSMTDIEEDEVKVFPPINPQLDEEKLEKKALKSTDEDTKKELPQEHVNAKTEHRTPLPPSSWNVKFQREQQRAHKKEGSNEDDTPLSPKSEPLKKTVSLKKERDYKNFLALKDGKGILLERHLKDISNKFNLRISSRGKTGSERDVFYNQRRIAIIHEPSSGHRLDSLSLELLSNGFNTHVLRDFNVTQ